MIFIVGNAKEVRLDLQDEVVMWLRHHIAVESKERRSRPLQMHQRGSTLKRKYLKKKTGPLNNMYM